MAEATLLGNALVRGYSSVEKRELHGFEEVAVLLKDQSLRLGILLCLILLSEVQGLWERAFLI